MDWELMVGATLLLALPLLLLLWTCLHCLLAPAAVARHHQASAPPLLDGS